MSLLDSKEVKKINISKTAYRALFVLKVLLKTPLGKDEIYELFTKDDILNTEMSDDTIRYTIKILRKCGCEIQRPDISNNYKYKLTAHPFKLNLEPKFIKCLATIRESMELYDDWELILSINNLYRKISNYSDVKNTDLMTKKPLSNICKDLIAALAKHCEKKHTIDISYNSPKKGLENITLKTSKLKYENSNLYLWGYSYEYEGLGYFRVDRIKAIRSVILDEKDIKAVTKKALYKLTGLSASLFEESPEERLVKVNDEGRDSFDTGFILVEAEIKNEFNFMQKVLSYGVDCTVLEPFEIKRSVIEKLLCIKKGYEK